MGTATTIYIGKLYECAGTTCVKYIFAGDQRIVDKNLSTGVLSYYHGDHLGSSQVVTKNNGTLVQRLVYYPFGKTYSNSSGSSGVPYKYTGQMLDDSTGFYFYNARYYNPILGRFIQPDTIVPGPFNPQNLNRYSYVGNNPINYTDPTGHWKLRNFLKAYLKVNIQIGMVAGSIFCPACNGVRHALLTFYNGVAEGMLEVQEKTR